MLRCVNSPINNYVKYSYQLYKKSANTTEIRGNISTTIAFDDSFDVSCKFYFSTTKYGQNFKSIILEIQFKIKIQNRFLYFLFKVHL